MSNPNLTTLRVVRGTLIASRDYFTEIRDAACNRIQHLDAQIQIVDDAIQEALPRIGER